MYTYTYIHTYIHIFVYVPMYSLYIRRHRPTKILAPTVCCLLQYTYIRAFNFKPASIDSGFCTRVHAKHASRGCAGLGCASFGTFNDTDCFPGRRSA